MAMNLRLDPHRQHALAEEAMRTGRSQSDVIRDALDAYLNDDRIRSQRQRQTLIEAEKITPARRSYQRIEAQVRAADDWSWDIEREDRF